MSNSNVYRNTNLPCLQYVRKSRGEMIDDLFNPLNKGCPKMRYIHMKVLCREGKSKYTDK